MAQNPLIPGYGGDMFSIDASPMLPDYMQGINEALARNQSRVAEQESKPKFDIGKFLLAWAGHLGDNLTGNPVYANTVQNRSESEAQSRASEEKRRRDEQWWVSQQEYLRANKEPDRPGLADQFDWYRNAPPEQKGEIDKFIQMMNPGMQTPVVLPSGAQQEGGAAPITATGPNGEKIRFNPQSGQWEPLGGTAGNGGGGFP